MPPNLPSHSPCVALVVEDEWLLRFELVDALEEAGVVVIDTEAAEEALLTLESLTEKEVG